MVALLVSMAAVVDLVVWGQDAERGGRGHLEIGLWTVLCVTVWALGRVAYLSERNAARRRQQQEADAAAAIVAERQRLARELHDIVAHAVTMMILQAAGAHTLVPDPGDRVGAALGVIERAGVQAMSELHRLLGLLRAGDEDDIVEAVQQQPRLANLGQLVAATRESGVWVDLAYSDTDPGLLDPSVDLAAYRLIQEALTNISKHGGRSPSAVVRLSWLPGTLDVSVRSFNGSGHQNPDTRISAISSGHGLRGLSERITLVGGSLHATPLADGFLVRASLPRADPRRTRDPRQEQ